MEKVLKEISEALEYHTKLLEELTLTKDENKVNASMSKAHINNMMADLSNHPVFKENPIMANAMTEMFNSLTKGVIKK